MKLKVFVWTIVNILFVIIFYTGYSLVYSNSDSVVNSLYVIIRIL